MVKQSTTKKYVYSATRRRKIGKGIAKRWKKYGYPRGAFGKRWKWTEKQKAKLRGKPSHLKGTSLTKEHCLKIANGIKLAYQNNPELRIHASKVQQGKVYSKESRQKKSASLKKYYDTTGRKTAVIKLIRTHQLYANWRTRIFERDNYTCVKCHIRGGSLEADHIKSFADIIFDNNIASVETAINCKELWDISNGRTMCKKCHQQTSTFGYKNTKHYKLNIKNNENNNK